MLYKGNKVKKMSKDIDLIKSSNIHNALNSYFCFVNPSLI